MTGRARVAVIAVGLVFACFRGEFLAGTPCDGDEMCGELFVCVDGLCASPGEDTDEANNPPEAAGDAYTIVDGEPLTVAAPGLLANDRDPDGDSIRVIGGDEGLEVTHDGGFTFDPGDAFGCETLAYEIRDGRGATATGTVDFSIVLGHQGLDEIPARGLGARIDGLCSIDEIGALGDFNGDRREDLALLENCASGERRILIAHGDPELFERERWTDDEILALHAADGVICDLDCPLFDSLPAGRGDVRGDGIDDFILTHHADQTAGIFFGGAVGVSEISAVISHSKPPWPMIVAAAIVGRVRSGLRAEVAVATQAPNRIFLISAIYSNLYLDKESSSIVPIPGVADEWPGPVRRVVGLGDVNGDGLADIGADIGAIGVGGLSAVISMPADAATGPQIFTLYSADHETRIEGVGDVNDDGVDDLAIVPVQPTSGDAPGYIVFGGELAGAVELELAVDVAIVPDPGATGHLRYIGPGDLGGDGVDDLVVVRRALGGAGRSGVTLVDGPLTGGSLPVAEVEPVTDGFHLDVPAGHELVDVDHLDVDDDGRPDLAILARDSGGKGYITLLRGGDHRRGCAE